MRRIQLPLSQLSPKHWRRFGRRGEHELARIHSFYERYGKKTVFICRFVPVVRGIASLPPGISRMQKR